MTTNDHALGCPHTRPLSTVRAVWVILRTQLLAMRNTYLRSRRQQIGGFMLGLLLMALAGGSYWLLFRVTSYLNSPTFATQLAEAAAQLPAANLPTDIAPFVQALPAAVLLALLALLAVSGFSSVLTSLFLSGDLDTIIVAPVPMRAVFVVKFFTSLRVAYVLMLALLLPALVGYGQAMGFGPAFFAATLLTLLLLPLLPVGLAALLVLAVVRVIPARRARDIVAALGALAGALSYVLSQVSAPVARVSAPVQSFTTLTALDQPLLPSTWAARALLAAGTGDWGALVIWGGLFAGPALLVFWGCLVLAEQLYYAGWANLADRGGRVRVRRSVDRPQSRSEWPLLLPPQMWAILGKDLRVFPRDLRNLQHLVVPLVLAAFWSAQMATGVGTLNGATPGFVQTAGPVGISLYICLTLSAALGGASISREGAGLRLLRVAPLSPTRLLIAKWLVAFLPFLLVGPVGVIVLALLRDSDPGLMLRDVALLLSVAAGFTGLSTGVDAAYPQLQAGSTQGRVSPRAAIVTSVGYLTYGSVAAACLWGLPAFGVLVPQHALALHAVGWLLHLGVTAVVWRGALVFGAQRLSQHEL